MTDFEKLCAEFNENKRMMEELTAIQDEIKQNIIAIMGNADTMISGAYKATYKAVASSRIDTAALKKVVPEIAEQFTKTTVSKRFIIA